MQHHISNSGRTLAKPLLVVAVESPKRKCCDYFMHCNAEATVADCVWTAYTQTHANSGAERHDNIGTYWQSPINPIVPKYFWLTPVAVKDNFANARQYDKLRKYQVLFCRIKPFSWQFKLKKKRILRFVVVVWRLCGTYILRFIFLYID